MKRGAVVTVALTGDYGKPRPALVVQADLFNDTHSSITVLPISSTIVHAPLFRITLDPAPENGLKKVSQIMVDKAVSVRVDRIGKSVGQLTDDAMTQVTRALSVWLGIA